jgi:glycoside/pentoside/hexuronide:cation symporter, GPH family
MIKMNNQNRECPTIDIITYSTGNCASSLVLNSLFGFAMLFYTDALGLSAWLAGIAMTSGIFLDAALDPIMGHISDITRSRYGRRHPYMLAGGLLMVVCFYFLWAVPDYFRTSMTRIFIYLLSLNLLLRTAFAVFSIPYTALGFQICTDYAGRTKLQGISMGMNMAANLAGPALSWAIFFQNKGSTHATNIAENYTKMGTVFSIASLFFVLLVFFFTLKYMEDSRSIKPHGKGLGGFFIDMKEIAADVYSRWVYAYAAIVMFGVAIASLLQMYVYEHFMKFSGTEKSFVHGGSMIGCGIGALFAASLVRRLDKRGAVYAGFAINVLCNFVLALLFLPQLLKPGQTLSLAGLNIPIATVIFGFFHAMYYFGVGVMFTVAISMIADISEINLIKTGVNKDGAYSAVYAFITKLAMSGSILMAGFCLTLIGFVEGKQQPQSHEVIWRLGAVMLLVGPIISLASLLVIRKYPVNKAFVEDLRKAKAIDSLEAVVE